MAGQEPGSKPGEVVERFRPTSGRIIGSIALALAVAVVVIGLFDRDFAFPAPVVWGALFGAALVWCSMLRPGLWATTSDLVMRNMASTVLIPLAAIDQVAVRQVVVVSAGEQRYVSPVVGRSWRQAIRGDKRPPKPGAATPYPVFVDERLHQLTEEARAKAGITLLSDEQLALAAGVRREWAWPEIALMSLTGLGFVASIFV